MNNIITYLKPVPFMKRFLGVTLMLFGIFALLFLNIIFGAIFLVLGLNLASTEGSQIDITSKTYRKIWSFLGIHIGKWEPCPEFEYVSVFRTNQDQTVNVVTATTTVRTEVILLNLFYGNKNITFYQTTDKADAFKVAEHFKVVFNIDILDATEKDKVWL
ncbi:hypothetical protein DVK85_10875 [Flavobacterium arcticum]|uniref:Uncharacterized protein n=1 Tax=Flavobacterium arcticum TaxID=1784713 RepID=A0A345HDP4_9FLAO|nr:hypothetical protein [Flavobacterium arcticum]AXG74704.1 hypothetical protein DVK85_10875 [Flavobacterium arcticum]KAF2509797.1 hypothetical protein E0W72_09805 [Flavobacterium arcticum]